MQKKNPKSDFDKSAKTVKQKTKALIEAIEQLDIRSAVSFPNDDQKKLSKVSRLVKSGIDVEDSGVWRAVLDLVKDATAGKVANMLFDAGASADTLVYGLSTENMPDPKIPTPLILAAIEKFAGGVALATLDRKCDLGQGGSWCENPLDFLATKKGYLFGREEIAKKMQDMGLAAGGKTKAKNAPSKNDNGNNGSALIFGGPALWGH